jgi:hypothetical protein
VKPRKSKRTAPAAESNGFPGESRLRDSFNQKRGHRDESRTHAASVPTTTASFSVRARAEVFAQTGISRSGRRAAGGPRGGGRQ